EQVRRFCADPGRFQHWHDSMREHVRLFRQIHQQAILIAAASKVRSGSWAIDEDVEEIAERAVNAAGAGDGLDDNEDEEFSTVEGSSSSTSGRKKQNSKNKKKAKDEVEKANIKAGGRTTSSASGRKKTNKTSGNKTTGFFGDSRVASSDEENSWSEDGEVEYRYIGEEDDENGRQVRSRVVDAAVAAVRKRILSNTSRKKKSTSSLFEMTLLPPILEEEASSSRVVFSEEDDGPSESDEKISGGRVAPSSSASVTRAQRKGGRGAKNPKAASSPTTAESKAKKAASKAASKKSMSIKNGRSSTKNKTKVEVRKNYTSSTKQELKSSQQDQQPSGTSRGHQVQSQYSNSPSPAPTTSASIPLATGGATTVAETEWTFKEPREDSLQDTEYFTLCVREFRRVRLLGTDQECGHALHLRRPQDLHFPLLEMFLWKRVVFDEFHEILDLDPRDVDVLLRFKSYFKWGMTGSPPVQSVRSIAAMANLLSVDLLGVSKEEMGFLDHIHQYAEGCACYKDDAVVLETAARTDGQQVVVADETTGGNNENANRNGILSVSIHPANGSAITNYEGLSGSSAGATIEAVS
ncbi:unnamed protein product, partial [Amoebophrya sp. A25]